MNNKGIYKKHNLDKYRIKDKDNVLTDSDCNQIIFNLIQEAIKSDEVSLFKILYITDLIIEIDNKELLLNTLKLFEDLDFYTLLENCNKRIELSNYNYSNRKIVRIMAIISAYYIRFKRLGNFINENFHYELRGNSVKVPNIDFGKSISNKTLLHVDNHLLNKKSDYNNLISEISKISLENNSDHERYIKFLERQRDVLDSSLPIKQTKKDVENNYWFFIGVKFATGELPRLFYEQNRNASATANVLGNKYYRPFISQTIANTTKSDKNIYSRKKSDLIKILDYCNQNSMVVTNDFETFVNNMEN